MLQNKKLINTGGLEFTVFAITMSWSTEGERDLLILLFYIKETLENSLISDINVKKLIFFVLLFLNEA